MTASGPEMLMKLLIQGRESTDRVCLGCGAHPFDDRFEFLSFLIGRLPGGLRREQALQERTNLCDLDRFLEGDFPDRGAAVGLPNDESFFV